MNKEDEVKLKLRNDIREIHKLLTKDHNLRQFLEEDKFCFIRFQLEGNVEVWFDKEDS